MTDSPIKQNRTLIDASEKPLRRSPPGKPHEEEEWPVLFPNRPTTPGTLRQMSPEHDGVLATTNAAKTTYQPAERYPRLPSLGYGPPASVDRKPSSDATSNHQIQRKQVSSPNLRKAPAPPKQENIRPRTKLLNNAVMSNNKPKVEVPVTQSTESSTLPQHSSTTGALAENPFADSKPSIEPRQTRTSSLRARISAGSIISEGPNGSNKVLGFTDFTSSTEPLATEKDIKRRSTPKPPGAYPVAAKVSRDSLRGKKPAQFVAGSRRPPSRGSLRSESRASANSAQLQIVDKVAADAMVPKTQAGVEASSNIPKDTENKGPEIASRKSSIPVFRNISSNVTRLETKPNNKEAAKSDATEANTLIQDQFAVFEDNEEDNEEKHPFAALDAIEESPYRGYHTRRLSMLSPVHGPTLKISPSADRIIMGTGSDKENETPKKKPKDKRRVLATLDMGSSSKEKMPGAAKSNRVTQPRPSSSLGLPQSASGRTLMDSETRAKKVRSADHDSTPGLKRLSHLSNKAPKSIRKNTDASTNDDPFFDAQSSIDKRISRLAASERGSTGVANAVTVQDLEWVPPVKKHLSLTADSDALLNPSEVQSIMTHEENPTDSVTADILSMMNHEDEEQNPFQESKHSTFQATNEAPIELPAHNALAAKEDRLTSSEPTPTTPEHSNTAAGSASGSLPPRSSSRTTHPDFIGNKHSPTSPLGNKENVPKAFTERQNRLGSLRGHATSQIDPTDPAPKRDSTRNSVARESNKSQGSISKGMLHNIKGLFHKRSSDETFASTKNGKKNKQQKVSVTSNGSPFPPISEIHPIHRPTLSSARRSNVNGVAPRSSVPELSTCAPPTPSINSPMPSELATTTTMAMQILDSARKEQSSPKKERLLELGKIMVNTITQARDAEKALEEAKHAARKAEVSYELCKKSVNDVKKVVEEWRDEMVRGGPR